MTLQWFLSGTVRQATEIWKHVRRLVHHQRDLLSPEGLQALGAALDRTKAALDAHAGKEALEKQIAELEKVAHQWLQPHPNPAWRENIEVLLVAIAVAMAVRTFFLQPFKIPTGSMQPTLYGVEYENYDTRPGFLKRVVDGCVGGEFYHELIAPADGHVVSVEAKHILRFINKLNITVDYDNGVRSTETLWFGPEDEAQFARKTGCGIGHSFRKGEPIVKTKEIAGDHLFVDRLTYNFRRPERGEIIVFKTRGIMDPRTGLPAMDQNQFYIKRMVAMGNERVKIGSDRHLRIDGKRLDASTPHFENVYNFTALPQESTYSGHVNGNMRGADGRPTDYLAPLFPDANAELLVSPNHYLVMGDNTMNSADSRSWGDFPRGNVIGKSYFVYWPISNHGHSRFGWGYR